MKNDYKEYDCLLYLLYTIFCEKSQENCNGRKTLKKFKKVRKFS